jgi:alkanesulfonate monooxygenase SsuD/methylene tetrahydromethanopterin reductase-like flavin-dependent oxidoreductase (luciferase family)
MVGCNGYRHPAVLAKIASTVDHVSGGRLDMGLGAGWFELEYNMYGIPFPRPAQRIAELDEALQMLKLLWTEELASFEGKYYTLKEARHEPKPLQKPYPPITLGGSGEQLMLRVVAKHADIYNGPGGSPEVIAHKNRVLDEHCAEVGRNPREIMRSTQFYLQSAGDVAGVREKVEGFLEVGIEHLCIGVPAEYEEGLVSAIAQEVGDLVGR